MLWFIICNCFMYFSTSVIALRCIIENNIVKEFAIENCSSSVTDCFLFRCDKSDIETEERGCNDNLSSLWNCQALGEACMQAGGKAYCDTCVKDLCNGAATFASSIATDVLSILVTLSIIFYV